MSASGQAAFRRAIDVSRETFARLELYADLLHRWNGTINLVSRASMAELWQRHFLDSAQLFALRPEETRSWVDIGSGGGFPGLVIAVLAAETNPDLRVMLVESDARKAAFLATAARELGVSAEVHPCRSESLAPLGADVLSARAVAPLPALLTHAARHLRPGGVALFPKGAGYRMEVDSARSRWRFDLKAHPSMTDADGVILELGAIAHA